MQLLKDKILEILVYNQTRHQLNDFPSGCSMIDFWINGDLFVIQLEPQGIGFSAVNEEIDFSTIPDEWYYDTDEFLKRIAFIIKKKSN